MTYVGPDRTFGECAAFRRDHAIAACAKSLCAMERIGLSRKIHAMTHAVRFKPLPGTGFEG